VIRILIVDDNPAVRRYLRAILEQQESWKVCGEARTGAEALHQVLEATPDLVVLDYQMPDLNGVDVARQIAETTGVVTNLNNTRTQVNALVSSSQSATGALQAAQSGNQLVALQTTQLADLTALMASIARAQSLEAARTLEAQAQAQAQTNNFLNYGSGYQSGSAQMFH